MGTRNVVDSQEKYQRWVWRIHPQCVVCQHQRLLADHESAKCKFKVPLEPGQQCLFMKPKEETTK